ncbi:MAG TPA: hypothetical protein VIY73_14735 [Polyangiaceae bacterium]
MVIAVPAFVGLAAQGALAQSHPAGRGRSAPHGAGRKGTSSAADAGGAASVASPGLTATPGVAPTAGATIPSDAGATVLESKTLDGGTKVFKFSELDIEGRLKSPQLVYFLRRVRAEFSAGDLGHRTFMREMSETRKESSF